jgi:exonuclease III
MVRRKVDVLCVQETRWKGERARTIGEGFKFWYCGYGKINGVGVVAKKDLVDRVVEVERVSDRIMAIKIEKDGTMLNIISAYAPQVGCTAEEKEDFWQELEETLEKTPREERVVLGADLNGHVGEGNNGDEEVMGRHGLGGRNEEGQTVVDFAKHMELAICNTYFMKKPAQRITYNSGGRNSQIDYLLVRRNRIKEVVDTKVVVGECVAKQHRMVVCKLEI